jgi:hypothetical protein
LISLGIAGVLRLSPGLESVNCGPTKSRIAGSQMRQIHVGDGLCLRFPGRDEEFNDGVEIGIIAVLMGVGERAFTRHVSTANIDQARSLAEKMGYHLVAGPSDAPSTLVTFRAGPARPKLALVHSRPDHEKVGVA